MDINFEQAIQILDTSDGLILDGNAITFVSIDSDYDQGEPAIEISYQDSDFNLYEYTFEPGEVENITLVKGLMTFTLNDGERYTIEPLFKPSSNVSLIALLDMDRPEKHINMTLDINNLFIQTAEVENLNEEDFEETANQIQNHIEEEIRMIIRTETVDAVALAFNRPKGG